MKRNLFKEHDSKVIEPPPAHKELRNLHILGSGWKKGDGHIPGVFVERSPESCIWSVIWSTAAGPLHPDFWYSIENMNSAQLLQEADDNLRRWPEHAVVSGKLAPLMGEYHAGQIIDANVWIEKLKQVISNLRYGYFDYFCLWSKPENLMQLVYRPGWGPPPEEIKSEYNPVRWTTTRSEFA